MIDETPFREFHGTECANIEYPEDVKKAVRNWKEIICAFHDTEWDTWTVIGIAGTYARYLAAIETYSDGSLRAYHMPILFFQFMTLEEFESLRKRQPTIPGRG